MTLKRITVGLLLGFVAISLGVAIADVAGLRSPPPAARTEEPLGERLVTYYFHSSTRCPTCRTIEALGQEAVRPDVDAGQMEWRVVNYEEPGSKGYVERFDLVCPSLVLVQAREGEVVRWKSLERIWELYDDRPAFLEYVQGEARRFKEERP